MISKGMALIRMERRRGGGLGRAIYLHRIVCVCVHACARARVWCVCVCVCVVIRTCACT